MSDDVSTLFSSAGGSSVDIFGATSTSFPQQSSAPQQQQQHYYQQQQQQAYYHQYHPPPQQQQQQQDDVGGGDVSRLFCTSGASASSSFGDPFAAQAQPPQTTATPQKAPEQRQQHPAAQHQKQPQHQQPQNPYSSKQPQNQNQQQQLTEEQDVSELFGGGSSHDPFSGALDTTAVSPPSQDQQTQHHEQQQPLVVDTHQPMIEQTPEQQQYYTEGYDAASQQTPVSSVISTGFFTTQEQELYYSYAAHYQLDPNDKAVYDSFLGWHYSYYGYLPGQADPSLALEETTPTTSTKPQETLSSTAAQPQDTYHQTEVTPQAAALPTVADHFQQNDPSTFFDTYLKGYAGDDQEDPFGSATYRDDIGKSDWEDPESAVFPAAGIDVTHLGNSHDHLNMTADGAATVMTEEHTTVETGEQRGLSFSQKSLDSSIMGLEGDFAGMTMETGHSDQPTVTSEVAPQDVEIHHHEPDSEPAPVEEEVITSPPSLGELMIPHAKEENQNVKVAEASGETGGEAPIQTFAPVTDVQPYSAALLPETSLPTVSAGEGAPGEFDDITPEKDSDMSFLTTSAPVPFDSQMMSDAEFDDILYGSPEKPSDLAAAAATSHTPNHETAPAVTGNVGIESPMPPLAAGYLPAHSQWTQDDGDFVNVQAPHFSSYHSSQAEFGEPTPVQITQDDSTSVAAAEGGHLASYNTYGLQQDYEYGAHQDYPQTQPVVLTTMEQTTSHSPTPTPTTTTSSSSDGLRTTSPSSSHQHGSSLAAEHIQASFEFQEFKFCDGCSYKCELKAKFCPECGHKFGGAASHQQQQPRHSQAEHLPHQGAHSQPMEHSHSYEQYHPHPTFSQPDFGVTKGTFTIGGESGEGSQNDMYAEEQKFSQDATVVPEHSTGTEAPQNQMTQEQYEEYYRQYYQQYDPNQAYQYDPNQQQYAYDQYSYDPNQQYTYDQYQQHTQDPNQPYSYDPAAQQAGYGYGDYGTGYQQEQSLGYEPQVQGPQTDPLQRKPHPIVSFGFGGKMLFCFPKKTAYGHQMPSGPVIVRIAKDILKDSFVVKQLGEWQGPLSPDKKTALQKKLDQVIADGYQIYGNNETVLLWQLLKLLAQNDGAINRVEEKFRELLLEELGQPGVFSTDATSSAVAGEKASPQATNSIVHHLLRGNSEAALAAALENQMWSYGLLISSRVSKAAYLDTITKFSLATIEDGHPLRTLLAVYADKTDLGPTEGTSGESLTDFRRACARWQENLSILISNRTGQEGKYLGQLGETLYLQGKTHAAHICFLLAGQIPEKYDGGKFQRKIILVGSAPHHPGALEQLYRDVESFHRTEVLEFALQKPLPHFQPFKLHHAFFLADLGFVNEAFRYCEAIGTVIHRTQQANPSIQGVFSEGLLKAFAELEDRLKKQKVVEAIPRTSSSSWFPKFDFKGLLEKGIDKIVGDDEKTSTTLTKSTPWGPQPTISIPSPQVTLTQQSFSYQYSPKAFQDIASLPPTTQFSSANAMHPAPQQQPVQPLFYQVAHAQSWSNPSQSWGQQDSFVGEQSATQTTKAAPTRAPPPAYEDEDDLGLNNNAFAKDNEKEKASPRKGSASTAPTTPVKGSPKPTEEDEQAEGEKSGGKGGKEGENAGFFGRLVGTIWKRPQSVHLPDEKNSPLKWDPVNKKWAKPEDEKKLPPPPTSTAFTPTALTGGGGTSVAATAAYTGAPASSVQAQTPFNAYETPQAPGKFAPIQSGMPAGAPAGANLYSAKGAKGKRGTRSRYVDVMNTSATDDDGPKVFLGGPPQTLQPLPPGQPIQPTYFAPGEGEQAQESNWI